MKSIAIDIGGTRIKIAIVNNGIIETSRIISANADRFLGDDLPMLAECIKTMLEVMPIDKNKTSSQISGIGIALPGIVDSARKRLITSNGKYEDAEKIDWEQWADEKFQLPIVLENDAKAAIMGELAYGVGVGYKDAVMMILGTGVGTAAVMNGKLLKGRHFQAGCLGGHFTITLNQNKCSCGNTGCVEANASSWALPIIAAKDPLYPSSMLSKVKKLDFLALEHCYDKGDKLSQKLVSFVTDAWSAGIINLIHAYDPELVILSGGVINFKKLIPLIIKKVHSKAWTPWGAVTISTSSTPDGSVLLGLHTILEHALEIGVSPVDF